MILQVLFYAELETFALKCKFNSKSLPPLQKFLAAPLPAPLLNFQDLPQLPRPKFCVSG